MIHFKNVSKKFGADSHILQDVNFTIEGGSFVFLIGSTGAGKTTIFRIIIKDIIPTEGEVIVGEYDLGKVTRGKIPHLRRNVGFVFQDLKLLMDRTVLENVMLPLEFARYLEKDAKNKAEEVLMEVGLYEMKDKFPLQLSGGERQRVAIARGLVFDPKIILADEPTGNLDIETSFQIIDLLKSINKKGTTIFMATHNDNIIKETDKRIITLDKGKIIKDTAASASKKTKT